MHDGLFKICGVCHAAWRTRETFFGCGELRLLGLQTVPRAPQANLVLLEHVTCGTAMSVPCAWVRDLLPDEPGDLPELRGTAECPGRCLELPDLEPCERRCAHARDRRLVLRIAELVRGGAGGAGADGGRERSRADALPPG